MKLSESFILKLKSFCDICSVFSSYVELKACGANMRCCCPFHAEKTPSCFVYKSTQSFYCFGCGIGGDVITFIEKIENLPYLEAVKFLAERVGLSMPNDELNDDYNNSRALTFKINREAAMFFHKNLRLKKGLKGLYYFKQRGLTLKTIVNFGLGYAPDDWVSLKTHLESKGYDQKQMMEAGLVLKSKSNVYYDKFRNRVMFPIINLNGEVVGFGGRVLGEGVPKYLNTPDSVVFKKGLELYGLNFAKKSGEKTLILCEGYVDVISLHQHGFENSAATLGTALTNQQVLLISRNFNSVIIAYDSDLAGRKAAFRACELFEKVNLKAKILKFEGAKDPDEYLKLKGAARLKNLIEEACSFENLIFDDVKSKFNLLDVDDKRKYVQKTCSLVAKMRDSIKRELFLNRLSSELNLSKSVLKSHVDYLIKKNRTKNNNKIRLEVFRSLNNRQRCSSVQNFSSLRLVRAQEGLIRILFRNPNFLSYVTKNVNLNCFNSNSLYGKIFEFLVKNFENGKKTSFLGLHQILSSDEISEFSRIINENDDFKNSEQELVDYVKILNDELAKSDEDVLKMSLEDLELKRQKKAKSKY